MAESRQNAGQLMLGRYEIISKIGKGGMGTVYKARQVNMDRIVALKVMPVELSKNEKFVHRFLREARSAASLNHPGIVQAVDAGEADGRYYFAMEYVEGKTLGDMLDESEKLAEERALEITKEVAVALDYAHTAGFIHRDIKPDNILISKDGKIKLADLGLAREAGDTPDRVTQTGAVLGTPPYISPEQVRGSRDIDGRADIYSLGGTLYHMLTGKTPYLGANGPDIMAKHLSAPVPNPQRVSPETSEPAAKLVQKMMQKNPDDRPQTGRDVVDMIDRILRGEPIEPEQKPWYKKLFG